MTVNSSVMRPRGERHAEGGELALRPAGAHAEHEAAPVSWSRFAAGAGGQERVPVGHDGDARPERSRVVDVASHASVVNGS